MVPSKGSEQYVVDRVVSYLAEVGCLYGDVIAKSDQESSLKSLVEAVGKLKGLSGSGKWIVEHSPVGASQSNGVIERGIQSVQGQLRVVRLALEKRYKVAIPAEHAFIAWAVEFAGVVLNRLEVGHDGKTAYQRLKGKRVSMPGLEFGEGVLWKPDNRTGALGKLSSSWKAGVYVGVRSKSGEFIIADREGIWKARSVRRRPVDERWDAGNLGLVRNFPWKTQEGAAVKTEVIHMHPSELAQDPVAAEAIPRQVYIRANDLHQHGFTSGCRGCTSIIRGRPRQGHSKACRERLQEALKDTDRFKMAEERINQYLADKLEEQDKKRAKVKHEIKTEDGAAMEVQPALAEGGASGSGVEPDERKRDLEDGDANETKRRSAAQEDLEMEAAGSKREPDAIPEGLRKKRLTIAEALAKMGANTNFVTSDSTAKRMSDDIGESLKTSEGFGSESAIVDPCSCSSESFGTSFLPDIYAYSKSSEMSFLPDIYNHSHFDFGGAENVGFADVLPDELVEDLDPVEVAKAREEELKELEKRVYEVVDVEEAWRKTGKGPIGVRWVDVRKKEGMYRSRLVAKDFAPKHKKNDIEGLYAAMPPLELVKLLMARATKLKEKIMLIDIKKAHLYAPIDGDAYVDLAPERAMPGKCARLKFTLYGMRVAAKNWENAYSATMRECGFMQGKANATSFYHEGKGIRVVVHGDDFIASGCEENLRWLEAQLLKAYPLKMRGILGPGPDDAKEGIILNRKITFDSSGTFAFEADSEHVPKMLKVLGLEGCNTVVAPGSKERFAEQEWELDPREASVYRSAVARGNYLSQDRADIRYTVKELCQKMSKPSNVDMARLKRLCRYLAGKPRVVQYSVTEDLNDCIDVFVDADWGGCERTRLSTSGGVIMAFGVCVKAWSTTQRAYARSSGEAELYAANKGATEGLGLQSMCHELGISLRLRVHTDSDACRGTCHRTGLGRLKHLQIEELWLQGAIVDNKLELVRVRREDNFADCLTKHVPPLELERQCRMMGQVAA
jgi:hypothetical protein